MKAIRICMIVCVMIFLFGIAGSIWAFRTSDATAVEILQDGKVLYTFDLSNRLRQERIEISCGEGVNVVLVGPEGICVESADCADQTCVKMGYLKSEALPIVCLPHRLTIRFAGESTEIDGISG